MLSNVESARFCRELGLMLHAGLGLGDSVYLLAREEQALGPQLEAVGAALDAGESLQTAMVLSGSFPAALSALVGIGERTGHLEEALALLAEYYEEQDRTWHGLRSAMAYPAMVFALMLGVLGVLLVEVLPVFDRVYASLGSAMTGAAAGLLYLGRLLKQALPLLFGLLLLAAAAAVVLRFSAGLRQRLWLGLGKGLGDRGVARKFGNARYVRGLAMGLSSGLSAQEAAVLAGKLLADVPGAARRCAACSDALEAGTDLEKALEENGFLSPAHSRLLGLGIRSGSGDSVMAELAGKLMEQAWNALDQAVSRVEPAMVLAASVLVGAILLAVMLPLMDILSVIG